MFDSHLEKCTPPLNQLFSPENLLFELLENSLTVVLIPAADKRHTPHKIRAVESQNAEWYREFCSLYQSNRRGTKWRTRIKRQATIKGLEKLVSACNKDATLSQINCLYVERLIRFICIKQKSEAVENYDYSDFPF